MTEHDTIVSIAGAFASAFGLIRYAIGQNRALLDRLIAHIDAANAQQAQVNRRFQEALDRLSASMADQARALERLGERPWR